MVVVVRFPPQLQQKQRVSIVFAVRDDDGGKMLDPTGPVQV